MKIFNDIEQLRMANLLHKRYYSALFDEAMTILNDYYWAENAAADAVLMVSSGDYLSDVPEDKWKAYLLVVTQHNCFKVLKRNKRYVRLTGKALAKAERAGIEAFQHETSDMSEAEVILLQSEVDAYLLEVSAVNRLIYDLRVEFELAYDEIPEKVKQVTGKSVTAEYCRVIVSNLKRRIREEVLGLAPKPIRSRPKGVPANA